MSEFTRFQVARDSAGRAFLAINTQVFRVSDEDGSLTRLSSITPLSNSFFDIELTSTGDALCIVTSELYESGMRLWRSDGTDEGTRVVTTIPKKGELLAVLGNKLIVEQETSVQAYDCSSGQSSVLFSARPLIASPFYSDPSKAYFFHDDWIWFTDGTAEQTRRVAPVRTAGSVFRLLNFLFYTESGDTSIIDVNTQNVLDVRFNAFDGFQFKGDLYFLTAGGRPPVFAEVDSVGLYRMRNIPSPTPTPTRTPTAAPTQTPSATVPIGRPNPPRVSAVPASGKRNSKIKVEYRVEYRGRGTSEEISIYKGKKRRQRIRLGYSNLPGPVVTYSLTFKPSNLSAGAYSFCVVSKDEYNRRSAPACAQLRLR